MQLNQNMQMNCIIIFCDKCAANNIKVEKGIFGADMKVSLLNDGPVTIIMEK